MENKLIEMQQVQAYRKEIKKHNDAIDKIQKQIDAIRQEIIDKYCPYKIGEKVILKRNVKGSHFVDTSDLIAYVARIQIYTISKKMKFHYSFCADIEKPYATGIMWGQCMGIEKITDNLKQPII